MTDKRMLIVPTTLVKLIDDNRGDVSQAEFIELLIESQMGKQEPRAQQYVTREEFQAFEQDIKKLLRSFIDFFVNYGLELGKQAPRTELEELTSKLKSLENSLGEGREVKLKWK
ncbi:MAG: hypothetical protein HY670_06875 [Chloroflexi bacterium]|nr:hypothetical protein [Chloroflexota bacterium]